VPPTVVVKEADAGPGPWPWVLVSAGGAAVVTGIVVIALGESDIHDVNAAIDQHNADPTAFPLDEGAIATLRDQGHTKRTAGYIVGGVGVAAVTIGVLVLVLDGGPGAAQDGPTATFDASGGSLGWAGTF